MHPVIISIGQATLHKKIAEGAFSALDLAKTAVDNCVSDTGRDDILSHLDSICLVHSFSEPNDSPVERLCAKLGFRPATREETTAGGHNPQWLVNRAADRIAAGNGAMTLLVGTEAVYCDKPARDIIKVVPETVERLKTDPQVVGDCRIGFSDQEHRYRLIQAPQMYALFENALRYHLGMSLSEYRTFLKNYYKKMAGIAADIPHAWIKNKEYGADITRVAPGNRMIAFPYTKLMNPNPAVNQAAALILTDTGTARKLSIPEDKWIYPIGGAEAVDKWFVTQRINYHSSPAIKEIVNASLEMAGLRLEDIDFFDLYSCYPCAASIAALSMGLSVDRLPPLSITGGLRYFGGPGNNYTMHAIAHTVARLRETPEQYGLVTGMGWFLTKHAAGIYSGVPPKEPWQRPSNRKIQEKIDAMASPALCERPSGEAIVETYTVMHDHSSGKVFPAVLARLSSKERCIATTEPDTALADAMEQEEFIGKKGMITPGDSTWNIIRF